MEPSYVILDCEGHSYRPQTLVLLKNISSGFNSYDSDKNYDAACSPPKAVIRRAAEWFLVQLTRYSWVSGARPSQVTQELSVRLTHPAITRG